MALPQFNDLTIIVLILSGIVYLGLFVTLTINRGIREPVAQLLVVYTLASTGLVVTQTILSSQQRNTALGFDILALQWISLFLLTSQAVIFSQLSRRFGQREDTGITGWIIGAIVLVLVILLYRNPFQLPNILSLVSGITIHREMGIFILIILTWGAFMVSALGLSIRNYRRKVSPLHRNRNTYWLLAVVLVLAGQVLFLFRLPLPASILHALGLFTAVFVQLTYHLPDLRVFTRRLGSFTIIGLITASIYTGGYLVVHALASANPSLNPFLAGLFLAAIIIILFNPLLNLVRRFTNGLFDRSRYDTRQTLSEYSMSISNILDIELLATIVIGLISEALEISEGFLVSVEYEPGESDWENNKGYYLFRSIRSDGHSRTEGCLPAKNPAVYFLRYEHHPLTQYDIDLLPRFREMDPEERRWLASLNMDVYVPIYAKDTWIGVLALGPKASGDRYFPEDLALLQTLADQTAVALENARLYDHLKQRNAENENLNKELQAANIELSRLDRAKSDFINIASHELRTPLTQVIGYNEILTEMIKANDLQSDTGLQMVGSVRKAARRLEEIVEIMFDVSKLESKTLDLLPTSISLASVISVAIDTWTRGIEERKLKVSVRGVANLPAIFADGKRLTQVFSHLIQNAIKSTPDGGQIRISGSVIERDGSNTAAPAGKYIEVVVADTGIGIAQEDLERVFEKFFRVGNVLLHSTGDTKFKGAGPGLGLTIARGIVEAHGGQIWAESPGYNEETCPGASFHVVLPIESMRNDSLSQILHEKEDLFR